MIRPRTTLLLALLLVSSAIAVAPVTVSADDDSLIGDVLEGSDDDSEGWLSTARAFVGGYVERASLNFRELRDGDWSPDDRADELADEYNPYSSDFEQYANDRTTASTSLDVVEIELVNDDESATRYLVADVENGSYANTSIVESTDRQVDAWVSLCGYAARNAPDELEAFREDFVEDDEDVSASYLAETHGRYGSKLRSDLVGDDERCDD